MVYGCGILEGWFVRIALVLFIHSLPVFLFLQGVPCLPFVPAHPTKNKQANKYTPYENWNLRHAIHTDLKPSTVELVWKIAQKYFKG